MSNQNYLCCFDTETSSPKPATTQILSIGAVILDPRSLEQKSEFYSLLKPLDFSTVEPEALAVNKLKIEDLEKAPDTKIVFDQFATWIKSYNKSRTNTSSWGACIACGYNIDNFDLPIVNRYCKMFGYYDEKREQQNLFNQVYTLDALKMMWWLNYSNVEMKSLKLTEVLAYMGVPATEIEKSHNSMEDAKNTANILRRFIALSTYLGERNEDGKSRLKVRDSLASLYQKEKFNG